VDGFDQDKTAGEADNSIVALVGLVASHRDAFEAFQFANGLLNPRPGLIEQLWKETRSVFRVGAVRDDRNNPALAAGRAVSLWIVPFISDGGARLDVGADVEGSFELSAVADFATGQMECDGQAVEVGLEVDLGRKSTPRATECLILLPPFAPAAETWARTTVLSNICTRCAVLLVSARSWWKASNTPERLSRQNRFQTLFHLPNSAGKALHVMLWTVK
jgi:hypothetical protein